MNTKLLQRVDVQVTLLIIAIVALSSALIYHLVYKMSYDEMISLLGSESKSVAKYIDDSINSDIFTSVTTSNDMLTASYIEAHALFDSVRRLSNIKYLYTATKNKEDELIYHVDGLPYTDPDFRKVGDLIEADFQPPLLEALNNKVIVPEDILSTPWGYVYVSYYPLHDENGNVIAALGIEFDADSQFKAYRNIRLVVNLVILLLSLFFGFIARILFQRISNPYFKDIYNTDSLTNLKNRNAYDTDIYNAIQRHELDGAVLVITDINGLKIINDSMGHKMGDFYIEACAKSLSVDEMNFCVNYRIGGDEFATIIPSKYANQTALYVMKVKEKLSDLCKENIPNGSASIGYAICTASSFAAWEIVQKAADESMYIDKKAYYQRNKSLDARK